MGFKVVCKGINFFNISDKQEGVVNVASVYLRFDGKLSRRFFLIEHNWLEIVLMGLHYIVNLNLLKKLCDFFYSTLTF